MFLDIPNFYKLFFLMFTILLLSYVYTPKFNLTVVLKIRSTKHTRVEMRKSTQLHKNLSIYKRNEFFLEKQTSLFDS